MPLEDSSEIKNVVRHVLNTRSAKYSNALRNIFCDDLNVANRLHAKLNRVETPTDIMLGTTIEFNKFDRK